MTASRVAGDFAAAASRSCNSNFVRACSNRCASAFRYSSSFNASRARSTSFCRTWPVKAFSIAIRNASVSPFSIAFLKPVAASLRRECNCMASFKQSILTLGKSDACALWSAPCIFHQSSDSIASSTNRPASSLLSSASKVKSISRASRTTEPCIPERQASSKACLSLSTFLLEIACAKTRSMSPSIQGSPSGSESMPDGCVARGKLSIFLSTTAFCHGDIAGGGGGGGGDAES
mmetsp:Transcript_78547/g.123810  ORF Transcript_78547/g.123810 Transcript_78547/m.123810 type:complete len:234 (-) Transcript_78547:12-713(-)